LTQGLEPKIAVAAMMMNVIDSHTFIRLLSVHPEMALFPSSGVLRGFPAATYVEYVSPQPLVRPCSTKKLLISELDT
jgi:hypothetical protein